MFKITCILGFSLCAFGLKAQPLIRNAEPQPSLVNNQQNTANRQPPTPHYAGQAVNHKPSGKDPIQTASGLVSGYYNIKTSVTVYKGIPFAAPPVGDLRWKAPRPVKPWKDVKKCVVFGPSPMQPKPVSFLMIGFCC